MLEARRLRLAAGGWRLEAGSWRLDAGGWWLEAGVWRLETISSSSCRRCCVVGCIFSFEVRRVGRNNTLNCINSGSRTGRASGCVSFSESAGICSVSLPCAAVISASVRGRG